MVSTVLSGFANREDKENLPLEVDAIDGDNDDVGGNRLTDRYKLREKKKMIV